jgi:gas vesicle protein
MTEFEIFTPILEVSGPTWSDYLAFISGIGGALLGAGIGACVSFLTARQASKETTRRDVEARKAEQAASALRLVVNVQMMHADLTSTLRAINECIADSAREGLTAENSRLWQRVPPIAVLPHDIALSAVEIAPYIAAKAPEVANGYMQLVASHKSDFHALALFNQLRTAIMDDLHSVQQVSGNVFGSVLTVEDLGGLKPKWIPIENLITAIVPDLEEHIELASKVVSLAGPAMRKHLGDDTFPIVKFNSPTYP